MRCLLAFLAMPVAAAWKLLPAQLPLAQRPGGHGSVARLSAASEGPRAFSGSSGGFSFAASTVALAAFCSAVAALRRRGGASRRRGAAVAMRAEDEIVMGYRDPKTKKSNYVNPWEQQVTYTEEQLEDMRGSKMYRSGNRYVDYKGPVYKQVPIVEGLQFPLDETLYRGPLEPPAPGVKWGDGRAPDGNWYMDVDGQKVQYWQGWGRRKTACAIVRILKGDGQFRINSRDAREYLHYNPLWWLKAAEPICAMAMKNDYDILAKCFGGGISGQAGAIRYALAKALQEQDFNLRPMLKKAKYLTRDPRKVEPKKPGKPKARKSKPYHKR